MLTVDTPVNANRENNLPSGFHKPLRPTPQLAWDCVSHPRWFFGMLVRTVMNHGMPYFENMGERVPPIARKVERDRGNRDELNWKHVELMRRIWKGKLVLKGVLNKEVARGARESGVDGVIVSNHGGRQLDFSTAPLRVLPAIPAEAKGLTVMMDGGIRRGNDVLKALALGAQFVFVGRPILYATAIGGGQPDAARRDRRNLLSLRFELRVNCALTALSRLLTHHLGQRFWTAAGSEAPRRFGTLAGIRKVVSPLAPWDNGPAASSRPRDTPIPRGRLGHRSLAGWRPDCA